jgi:hypothetical protein
MNYKKYKIKSKRKLSTKKTRSKMRKTKRIMKGGVVPNEYTDDEWTKFNATMKLINKWILEGNVKSGDGEVVNITHRNISDPEEFKDWLHNTLGKGHWNQARIWESWEFLDYKNLKKNIKDFMDSTFPTVKTYPGMYRRPIGAEGGSKKKINKRKPKRKIRTLKRKSKKKYNK